MHSRRPHLIETGHLRIDTTAKSAQINGEPLRLKGKEYPILELLSRARGTTLGRDMLLAHLYGEVDQPETGIIDIFMSRLQRKMAVASGGKQYIVFNPGKDGYLLQDPHAVAAPLRQASQ